MTNCLIVAATPIEINPFLTKLRNNDNAIPCNLSIDVLITGIGLTSTTYSLCNHLSIKKPDMIIQAGVGGCFDTTIKLGAVVSVKQDAIADESVIELQQLKTLFDLNLIPHNQFPYKKGWLVNPHKELLSALPLKKVKGISVNQITTNKKITSFYKNYFNPVVESMEGAALHYVCLRENVPFLQIRSISNYIGERNKKNWNMENSIVNLNNTIVKLLQSF